MCKNVDFTLAHSITIHKVQGMTLNNLNVYIPKKFEKWPIYKRLLYVALTRVNDYKKIYFHRY